MKTLAKSVFVVGQVFGLVMGSNFTIPADETLGRYPHLRLHV